MALPPARRPTSGSVPAPSGAPETREAALARIRGIARPEPAAPAARAEAPAAPAAAGRPRRRLIGPIATAVSESEIAQQLRRLARLWAADEIDMDAPRGSYLNFLV